MAADRAETDPAPRPEKAAAFRLAVGFAVVGMALVGVFRAADWYGERVSMLRYCDDPAGTAALVSRVLAEPRPAGSGPLRRHVVAAKLLFLVPQRPGEDAQAYAARLRHRIEAGCAGGGGRALSGSS